MNPLAVGVGPAEVIVAECVAAAVVTFPPEPPVAETLLPAVVTLTAPDAPAEGPVPDAGSVKLAEVVLIEAAEEFTFLDPDAGGGTGRGAEDVTPDVTTEPRAIEEVGAVVLVAVAEELAVALELEEVVPLRVLLVLVI